MSKSRLFWLRVTFKLLLFSENFFSSLRGKTETASLFITETSLQGELLEILDLHGNHHAYRIVQHFYRAVSWHKHHLNHPRHREVSWCSKWLHLVFEMVSPSFRNGFIQLLKWPHLDLGIEEPRQAEKLVKERRRRRTCTHLTVSTRLDLNQTLIGINLYSYSSKG